MADTATITPERYALLLALAQQAAAWWRDQLAGPGYLSKFRNGDTSQAGETAQVMASLSALRSPGPRPESLDCFEQELQRVLWERMQGDPCPTRPSEGPARYVVLSVDYGPEGELGRVARSAGVAGFPWKTTMWVNWDARPECCYVEVRAGYGRPTQRLPAVGAEPPTLAISTT